MLILSWLVAFSLRSGFVGLGPALPALVADLRLSFAQASFLVAVPTLLMGVMAVPGGGLADRWGPGRVIALGLACVATGGGLRAATSNFAVMLAITVPFGIGIGISQPSLPRLMRAWFPRRLGVTTGVYASGIVCGSIVGSAVSGLALAQRGGDDAWRVPIALWGVIAGVTLAIWVLAMRPWQTSLSPARISASPPIVESNPAWNPWRDRLAWISAAIFAAQGLVYYLIVAWLPAIYDEAGADPTATAALFTVFNAATLPGILIFPIWSDRLGRRRPPTFLASLLFLIGAVGLLLAPFGEPWRWLWPALAGAGVSGAFGMALVLPADIAPRGRTGAAAGMVLAIGYAAAALGPFIAGVVRDMSGSFAAAVTLLPAVGLVMIVLAKFTPEKSMAARAS